jgi:hypothetical protein
MCSVIKYAIICTNVTEGLGATFSMLRRRTNWVQSTAIYCRQVHMALQYRSISLVYVRMRPEGP